VREKNRGRKKKEKKRKGRKRKEKMENFPNLEISKKIK
jgi:hypothetical protein